MDEEVKLKPPSEKGSEQVPDSANEEIEFAPIIDYFGMDRPDLQTKNDLRELYGLITEGERLSKGEMLMRLRDVELKLGNPPTGENRLRRIIRYLSIDKELTDLLKEQRSFIR